jgi:lipid-A-disaccharide synthase
MRIFISTGEVSGDLQGSFLVEALLRQAKLRNLNLELVALGGDRMAQAGAKLLGNTVGIGSVGLVESLPFIFPTLTIQDQAKQYLEKNPPDLMILIDYMGPNLVIGNYVRQHFPDLPIVYYIAPQNWVWSPFNKNTEQIVAITDLLLAIFPEEARFFQKKGASVTWVGHPLLDWLENTPNREQSRQKLGISPEKTVISLLPASRRQEIKSLLPIMAEAARKLQEKLAEVHFLIPVSLPSYHKAIAKAVEDYQLQATLLDGNTQEAIAASDLAITKSGTVNLEIALLKVPQVVIYKVHPLTMWIGRKLFNFSIPFMSPPNLVMMRSIVPELLQEQATSENIVQESLKILLNPEISQKMSQDYEEMRQCLGEVGVCDRAANHIFTFLKV